MGKRAILLLTVFSGLLVGEALLAAQSRTVSGPATPVVARQADPEAPGLHKENQGESSPLTATERDFLRLLYEGRDPSRPAVRRAECLFKAAQILYENRMDFTGAEPVPDKRSHYRYIASDLMWESAQLLPDNEARTARALYTGGTYLMNSDPKEADRFYKALVRRNPNLAVAREADQLRWFPPAFTDAVLYRHDHLELPQRGVSVVVGKLKQLVKIARRF